jgi:hypothetical protein
LKDEKVETQVPVNPEDPLAAMEKDVKVEAHEA